MAEITAALVKELREKSGAGMMDCKKALTATGGDLEKAMDELRKQGLASAQKRSSRATKDGAVDAYIHAGGKIGVLVEVGVETDFVSRSDPFKEFTHDLAMHVAAASPSWVTRDEVPEDVVAREKAIYAEQVKGKPENVLEKIVTGKLEKFFAETCLMEQAVHQGPRSHHRAAAHRPRRRHRRERGSAALRALPARRDGRRGLTGVEGDPASSRLPSRAPQAERAGAGQ